MASCEKPELYDEAGQYLLDEALIKKWADSTKTELIKDSSGFYYKILDQGTGTSFPTLTDTISSLYIGRLLTDSIFSRTTDSVAYKFVLGNSIEGWKRGLPLIKQGGRIRLLIPSKMAYRNYDIVTGVPKNSVLNFEVSLIKIAVKK